MRPRKLVCFVEEDSMRVFLDGFLPRLLPDDCLFQVIPHRGKQDLERSLRTKLPAWREPHLDVRFLVLRDQDSEADCRRLKRRLTAICDEVGFPDTTVRIVCRELEGWYLGDRAAIDAAYGSRLARSRHRELRKIPDDIHAPSRLLRDLVPGFRKRDGARRLADSMAPDPGANGNRSFGAFVTVIRALAGAAS